METPVSGAPRTVRHEFAVVDRSGRLQIPRELREAARLGAHVVVALDDGQVVISRDTLQQESSGEDGNPA